MKDIFLSQETKAYYEGYTDIMVDTLYSTRVPVRTSTSGLEAEC